jgi:class 3 adenylate cyclase
MANSYHAGHGADVEVLVDFKDLAGALADEHAAFVYHRYAYAIITSVFHLFEAVNQYRGSRLLALVTYNRAHNRLYRS